ncbi:MAG: hypothetical protein JKY37_05390 [Nannocystaceae bacterium]|nr:hypothetical protein [Nannocystaceae bacterium]
MSGDGRDFAPHYQRVLGVEQRHSVLAAIRQTLAPSATLGEIVDAADLLGWGRGVGELRLVGLAEALLSEPPTAPANDTTVVDDAAVVDAAGPPVEVADVAEAKAGSAKAKKVGKKVAGKKVAGKKSAPTKSDTKRASGKKTAATRGNAAKPTAKKVAASKKTGKVALPTQDAFDERMSLEEAIEAFVPLVEGIGEATMQDLEEATGLGRRKLRFHVGQLVKNGHLHRHGMGRGTFYSVQ